MHSFLERLLRTLRAAAKALGEDGVIVGSEVPNLHLLRVHPRARGLFVSEDVDVAFRNRATARALRRLRPWRPSPGEPSVLVARDPGRHLEINLLGIDPDLPLDEAEVDRDLGVVRFGTLNLIEKERISIGGTTVPVATLPSIAVEKLATARSGPKGDRDLRVARLAVGRMDAGGLSDARARIRALPDELRYHAAGNLGLMIADAVSGASSTPRRLVERLRALLSAADRKTSP